MSATGSGIEGLRPDNAFARLIGANLGSESFKLIDVGCSGGLPIGFRAFGDRLSALAFDGLPDEIARLAAAEENPNVRYVAGMVGLRADDPLRQRLLNRGYWHNWTAQRYAFERHADLDAAKAEGRPPRSIDDFYHQTVLRQDWPTWPKDGWDLDYAKVSQGRDPAPAQIAASQAADGADTTIDLAAFAIGAGFADADFVKLDIDGPDFEVLRSINGLLTRPSLLGVALEVNFVGSHDANDNTFHNMDRLMREKGFDLVALSVRTYSSAALPFRYLDAHPSMNEGGRPVQGDAVYVRDLGSRVHAETAAQLSDEKLAKAAALLAMFSLPDWAAEMLLVHRARLARLFDVEAALDVLAAQVQENHDRILSFRDYTAAFEARDPRFFDLYSLRNDWMDGLLKTANAAPDIESRLGDAEREVVALRQSLAEAHVASSRAMQTVQAEAQEAEARLAAVLQSTSWRLTAALRRLVGLVKR